MVHFKVLHSSWLSPYSKILDSVGANTLAYFVTTSAMKKRS